MVSLYNNIITYDSQKFRIQQVDTTKTSPGFIMPRSGGGGSSEPSPGYTKVDYAKYKFKVVTNRTDALTNSTLEAEELLEIVNKYTVLLFSRVNGDMDYVLLTGFFFKVLYRFSSKFYFQCFVFFCCKDVHSSGLHITYQLIQILVITAGEIMFSISGLSFAYAEAPQSMKSVISATWLLTVAFGNLIVVIIAELRYGCCVGVFGPKTYCYKL